MTTQFQAGVGPNMTRCHIYRVGDDPRLSLCASVVIARNYKADLDLANPMVCQKCAKKFLEYFVAENPEWMRANQNSKCPPASALGVSELTL